MSVRSERRESSVSDRPNEWSTQDVKLESKPFVRLRRLTEAQLNGVDTQPDINDFMRGLSLISKDKLSSEPIKELNQWYPLRDIARTEAHLICDWSQPNGQPKSKKSPQNPQKSLSKTIVAKKTTKTVNTKLRRKRQICKLVSQTPIGSDLFNKLWPSLSKPLTSSEVTKAAKLSVKLPEYQSTKELLESHDNSIVYNNWTADNIESNCHKSELSVRFTDKTAKPNHQRLKKGFTHWITFSRRQRLDKLARMKSGLKWKHRLEARHMKTVEVKCRPLEVIKCCVCGEFCVQEFLCEHLNAKTTEKKSESEAIEMIDLTDEPSYDDSVFGCENEIHNDLKELQQLVDKSKDIETRFQTIVQNAKTRPKRVFTEINEEFVYESQRIQSQESRKAMRLSPSNNRVV